MEEEQRSLAGLSKAQKAQHPVWPPEMGFLGAGRGKITLGWQ